jgi:hypothetical protein
VNRLFFIALSLLMPPLMAQVPPPEVLPVKKPATDGKVWGALIYASNGDHKDLTDTDGVPDELDDLDERLGKVFPFKRFEILGQHTQDIFRQYESWVVPSKELFIKLDSKGPAEGGGINLNLQFWNNEQVLVKTDTVLRQDSPLFIGGPKWKDGKLLFVLLLTSEEGKK